MDQGLGGGERTADDHGDLLVAHFIAAAEQDGSALVFGQFRERQFDFLRQLAVEHGVARQGNFPVLVLARRMVLGVRVGRLEGIRRMTGAAAEFVEAQIAGNGEEPGGKAGGNLVTMGGFMDLEKDGLGDILRFGGVAQVPVHHVHDRLFVFVHQFGKSPLVPALDAKHQDGIGVRISWHWYVSLTNTGAATRFWMCFRVGPGKTMRAARGEHIGAGFPFCHETQPSISWIHTPLGLPAARLGCILSPLRDWLFFRVGPGKTVTMISFIVPAHNEQSCIGRTLEAIHDAARAVGRPHEIIVVDDASTDATGEIARQHQATVVPVRHRQIAATRNSGARAAQGERLFFVDADTTINARAVASALRAMDQGAAGGGAPVWFEGDLPLYVRLFAFLPVIGVKLAGLTGGAFMFCTRRAFQTTGGFNERLYWGEESFFALALQKEGPFVVLWRPVRTSGRRFRTLSLGQLPVFLVRMVLSPVKTFTRRSSVEKIWYDSNREGDDKMPGTLGAKVFNGVALVILTVLVTGPIWNFIPWSRTPWSGPLGKLRLVIGAFLDHVGLLLWPCSVLLMVSLLRQFLVQSIFRQRRWTTWIKLAALITFCVWQAWESTRGVIWFWAWLGSWLAHCFKG
jgi:hypothetical protein